MSAENDLRVENERLREAVNRQFGEPIDEVYTVDGLKIVSDQIHTLRRERDEARAEAHRLRAEVEPMRAHIEEVEADRESLSRRVDSLRVALGRVQAVIDSEYVPLPEYRTDVAHGAVQVIDKVRSALAADPVSLADVRESSCRASCFHTGDGKWHGHDCPNNPINGGVRR